ncbi:MAG TPA: protein phosphatase CheZ [Steroidobacteraceae bacterium]|nr:protein phosphatase CheZ [Steroidobacteraceae bacterium]
MAAERPSVLHEKYGDRFEALARAYAAGQELEFEAELDELLRVRERSLFVEIGRLSRDLNAALERFTFDSRIVDLAEKDVPDARQRLAHVLTMTDEAAHRTMDLVEGACPLAERTRASAASIAPLWDEFRARRIEVRDFRSMLDQIDRFLADVQVDAERIRSNLSEVLLAQGYQDLTGQIIRSVMHLVEEVEQALGNLVRLSNTGEGGGSVVSHVPTDDAATEDVSRRGYGPPVPGVAHGTVVTGQQDVDSLLSGLGL